MNDRFKFRVWDKAENKYNGFSFLLTMLGKLDRLSVDGDLLATDENQFTIEQCTGLKDKNGKLIYEGDVILFAGVKMSVEWSSSTCRWVLSYADKKHSHYGEKMSLVIPQETYLPNEYKAIGNVHQKG